MIKYVSCITWHSFKQAQETIATLDPEEQLVQSAELTQQLIEATQPQNRSLLPNDLQASTRILTTVLQVLEDNDNATTDLVCICTHYLCFCSMIML